MQEQKPANQEIDRRDRKRGKERERERMRTILLKNDNRKCLIYNVTLRSVLSQYAIVRVTPKHFCTKNHCQENSVLVYI